MESEVEIKLLMYILTHPNKWKYEKDKILKKYGE